MAIDYHFVHDHVTQVSFIVSHISSKDQLADALTKPLHFIIFKHLHFKIDIFNGSTILRGHDKAYPSPLPISTNSPTSSTTHLQGSHHLWLHQQSSLNNLNIFQILSKVVTTTDCISNIFSNSFSL